MQTSYIFALEATKGIETIGNKARNLRFLAEEGFLTPATYVCTWDAYTAYLQEDAQVVEALRAELAAMLDLERRYAVRSSANLEDLTDSSFAGQFSSVLDVEGVDGILQAIWSVWSTTRSPASQTYLERSGHAIDDLKMAVVIQEMVHPHVSGVAFSKNPITGLDEVLVEAVRGHGTALVQEGVTPGQWINKWGTWTHTPESSDDGSGIELALIGEVVRETKEIARAYGRPIDLEWVYDGDAVHWVQLREITSLDIPVYSNRISREVFPGIIKPLIWSVNVPLVNGAWVRLLAELIGPHEIEPEDLAGYFYSRAYFNMAALGQVFELLGLPRETLELLMGIEVEGPERPSFRPSPKSYALLPRMLRFGVDKVRFARKVDAFLPAMDRRLVAFHEKQAAALGEAQLLAEIDRLYPLVQEAAYFNIVTPLLMQVHNRMLKGQLSRLDVDFESFDLTGGMEELERFEPNVHLVDLHRLYRALDEDVQDQIREGSYAQLATLVEAEPLREGIARFLAQFGHLSDSGNDFSHEPWRENPDLVVQIIVHYTALDDTTSDKLRLEDLSVPLLRRPILTSTYRRARQFRWYREAVSSLYTFGYGLFRDYFLALGDRFVDRGVLAMRDDVFYLYLDEVREIVETGHLADDAQALVQERMAEIERDRDAVPPNIIYGDEAPPLDPHPGQGFQGTPTSRGYYTGRTRVVTGIQDMGKLQQGDVLVIPYSDVGWTPLFTKAGAVVAESGGILSHSSIIAREYGIPAVVSVPGACQIADDSLVTVDGYRGEVVVHEAEDGPAV
ncbi:MAG: PEP/pyruvate-binding domain-containing protein [Anaerolineae bacterium]|jgi:pyruvate,water dikinase